MESRPAQVAVNQENGLHENGLIDLSNASAKLLATVVFPSPGLALVITMTRGLSPFSPEYRIEVSVARNESAKRGGFVLRSHQLHLRTDARSPISISVSRLLSVLVVSEESAPFCLC